MPSTLELGVGLRSVSLPCGHTCKATWNMWRSTVFAPCSAGTASGGQGSQGNTVSLIIGQSHVREKCMNNEL